MVKVEDMINNISMDIEKQMEIEIYNQLSKELGIHQKYFESKDTTTIIESNLQFQLWKKQFENLFNTEGK